MKRSHSIQEYVSIAVWLAVSPVLAVINYLWLAMTDDAIAALLGGFRRLPSGWTEIGAISWTFSSLLGPAMSLAPSVALGLALYTGITSSLFVRQVFASDRQGFFRANWLSISFTLLWVVRIPVPLEWSLFYWVAVRY